MRLLAIDWWLRFQNFLLELLRDFNAELKCLVNIYFIFYARLSFHDNGAYFRDGHTPTGDYDKNFMSLTFPNDRILAFAQNASLYFRGNEDQMISQMIWGGGIWAFSAFAVFSKSLKGVAIKISWGSRPMFPCFFYRGLPNLKAGSTPELGVTISKKCLGYQTL